MRHTPLSASTRAPASRVHGLFGDGATLDIGSETHGRGPLTSGKDGPRSNLLHILKELGFGCAWISTEQHVDVTTKLVLLTYGAKGISVDYIYVVRMTLNLPSLTV